MKVRWPRASEPYLGRAWIGPFFAPSRVNVSSCPAPSVMSFLSSSQKALVDRIGGVVDDVEARMMFGSVGLFADNQQFGILDDDDLYLCVDDDHRSDFDDRGTEPYSAETVEQAAYLEVPDGILQDEATLATWIDRAVRAAES